MKLRLSKETLISLSSHDQSLVEGAAAGEVTSIVAKTYGPECLISSALPPTHRPDCISSVMPTQRPGCAIVTNPRTIME